MNNKFWNIFCCVIENVKNNQEDQFNICDENISKPLSEYISRETDQLNPVPKYYYPPCCCWQSGIKMVDAITDENTPSWPSGE